MGKAIFQQRSGILGVAVAADCGVVSAEQLIGMGEIAKKLTVHGIKMTARQTVVFLLNSQDLAEFTEEIKKLGLRIGVFGNVVRSVKGCAGNDALCKRSHGDAHGLGVKLQQKFMNQDVPKDFKISVAGCPRACTDPYCADFGVIATGKDAFSIYLGGRGGSKKPVHGKLILETISADGVTEVLEYVLNRYRELGKQDERLCKTIERCGISSFVPAAEKVQKGEDVADDFLAFMLQK